MGLSLHYMVMRSIDPGDKILIAGEMTFVIRSLSLIVSADILEMQGHIA